MSDAKNITLNIVNLAFSIALLVFTWQHSVVGMVLSFAGSFAAVIGKDD